LLIYTIQGQLIFKKTGINASEISLNLMSCQPGLYLMKAKLANNKFLNYKIIKR
jgi:hypothetical protein